ncbi:thioredoxin domain-containing protein [Thalassospira sp. MCCC 1A03138]|uniref:thioredoxin domain-containing protein n=1 Tax=Thalassospira sp. MCCC 1A03138 TaxID=1470576 RepID=UPI000A1DAE1E|nr:thioredoxin domain-containing protein [Thalassospira sp. MCCC 1A03138]OSQ31700.1 thymidylate kinase [Thalassospira sp. MCCC 1A03138]
MELARNNLGSETSPYLVQHRDNPVHWQPWSAEILAKAKAANKPILLSVGYAACHWCHVMAHESFEDEGIAALMNELFINIKLDREERPDLDALYQNALALLGQQGGWPLTMFLTPDGEPFWGGTYFPKEARYGRPGFGDVLKSVSEIYTQQPDNIRHNVAQIGQALIKMNSGATGSMPSLAMIDQCGHGCLQIMDGENGGTNGAPKFPQPSLLALIWRVGVRTNDTDLKHIVRHSLDRMCQGGIYDHVGGGFARYAVDDQWLVPHFEKMLYDNAQLIDLLCDVWRETGNPLYEARISETIDWILRDMRIPGGAFAASLDADSEGIEGKFYVWDEAEINAILGNDAALFKDIYDVSPTGNWEHKNILNRTQSGLGLADRTTEKKLSEIRTKLLAVRNKRIWPGWDDKALTDWNAMTITALAEAAMVFKRADWLDYAKLAYNFVINSLMTGESNDRRFLHSYRNGKAQHAGMLEDYAHMICAALRLYECFGEDAYLREATEWCEAVENLFADTKGGYFQSASDTDDLVVRQKPHMDNAVPAGNSVMAQNLARLYALTGDTKYRDRAEITIAAFAGRLNEQFPNIPGLLLAAEMLQNPLQIVLVAKERSQIYLEMRHAIFAAYLPNRAITILADTDALPDLHPAKGKTAIDGHETAYVCQGLVCSAPVTNAPDLAKLLADLPTSAA